MLHYLISIFAAKYFESVFTLPKVQDSSVPHPVTLADYSTYSFLTHDVLNAVCTARNRFSVLHS
jgi:hypothetical protein